MLWHEIQLTGVNAYFDWTLGPGKFHSAPTRTTRRGTGVSPFALLTTSLDQKVREELFGLFFDGSTEAPDIPDLLTAFLKDADMKKLSGDDLRALGLDPVRDIVLAQKLPEDSICSSGEAPLAPAGSGAAPAKEQAKEGAVVIGIIDIGMGIAHERFRNACGSSRIAYCWLQDGRCEHPIPGIAYGRDLAKHDRCIDHTDIPGIDTLLTDNTVDGVLDETAFNRAIGLIDFSRGGHIAAAQRISHGAHVMDLAAGQDADDSSNAERPIICVQLPAVMVRDTSGRGLEKYLADAVDYILERAQTLRAEGDAPHVVINFSSGLRAGPRDGSTLIERHIDEQLAAYRSANPNARAELVLPSGNANLVQGHAKFDLASAAFQAVEWRVQPEDRTSSFMEIWLEPGALSNPCSQFSLTVKPPGQPVSDEVLTDDMTSARQFGGTSAEEDCACRVYFERTGDTGRYLIALAPTATFSQAAKAPSGPWRISLQNNSPHGACADAWIHWDTAPIGFPAEGRPSYFNDADYQRLERPSGRLKPEGDNASMIKRASTTNAAASGNEPVVIGGYRQRDGIPADYSSTGPIFPLNNPKLSGSHTRDDLGVDAAAVSDRSVVSGGILAAGPRPGSVVALNGTSVAAPQAARILADKISAGAHSGHSAKEIIRRLAAHEDPDAPGGRQNPFRVGHGRLKPRR